MTSPKLAITAMTIEKKGSVYAIKDEMAMHKSVTPSHRLRLLQPSVWWCLSSWAYLKNSRV
jgi:hypothetical protein